MYFNVGIHTVCVNWLPKWWSLGETECHNEILVGGYQENDCHFPALAGVRCSIQSHRNVPVHRENTTGKLASIEIVCHEQTSVTVISNAGLVFPMPTRMYFCSNCNYQ